MKKAFDWLNDHKITYEFHDYKTGGISPEKLDGWLKQQKPEMLVNNKGTTFRAFPEELKEGYKTAGTAKKMMLANQSVIKRPVLEKDGVIIALGFKPEVYEGLFAEPAK